MTAPDRTSLRYLTARVGQGLESLRILRGLRALAAHEHGQAHDFTDARTQRLVRILGWAAAHCPEYRARFRDHGVDPATGEGLDRLPPIDKAVIRERRERLVADTVRWLPHQRMNTGGSTGEPLEFLISGGNVDPPHQTFLWRLLGFTRGDVIVACDGTTVPEGLRRRQVYWVPKGKHPAYGNVAFSSLYLDDRTSHLYAASLRRVRPAFLRGYPSVLAELAAALERTGGEAGWKVKGVVLTSENAFPDQIERIERVFGVPVALQYGHSEAAIFAYALRASESYRCSPFYGLTEVLRPDGRHAQIGEDGEVVVTGFHGFAMPFIRYRTGDMAIYGGEDAGVVRLNRLEGRTQDVVHGAGGERVSLTALVFGCHYRAFAAIRRWQLVQRRAGHVTVRIVRAASFTASDEEEIRRSFERVGHMATEFEYVDELPRTPRGKSQLLVQECR